MALPIPISVQANRLEKYGIDSGLKEDFSDITYRCKISANNIKADKASLEALQKSYESDKAYLASKGLTLNPSEIMKRRALSKSLQATKKSIKRRKYEIKNDKLYYKKLVEQRKALRKKIKEKYEANKDKIKEIRDDKWKERREKLKEMGIIVAGGIPYVISSNVYDRIVRCSCYFGRIGAFRSWWNDWRCNNFSCSGSNSCSID